MVFQTYALYPHLTVFDNIAFSLRLRKMKKEEIRKRVVEAAKVLGLDPFLDKKPRSLSGGQRQRVAMGRAIVRQPQAFLMDEPLSNLDAKLRVQMRAEISRLTRSLGVTTIYVTHDQVEAMTMGDRVAVMRKGELQQVAPPQELYDHPLNVFVGGFIGSPAMNLIEASLERSNGTLAAVLGDQRISLDDDVLAARPALKSFEGNEVVLGIRPEHLDDASLVSDAPEGKRLRGEVELTEALGSELMVHFKINAPPALTEEVKELAADVGEVAVSGLEDARAEQQTTMVGRFGVESRVKNGETGRGRRRHARAPFFRPGNGAWNLRQTERSHAMTRRWIALLAVCLLAVGTATSCGGDDGGGGSTAKGTGEITIFSLWGGSEQEAFQKVLTQFTADTGIKTKYESARDFLPVIRTRLAADNPPMVAIIPRPGFVAELAQDDVLIPLEDLGLDADKINENYTETWTSLATVDDTVYGVVAKANSKSTVWYKPASFQENSFEIPTDFNQLIDITKQYKAKGKTPWAVGAQGDDNSWTLTDWFEQIYVRQAGPEKYSQLFETGEVKFNDQSVKDALTEMVKIVNDDYVAGGIDTALGISFVDAIGRVFGKNPKAEMFYEGGFVGGIAIGQVNPSLKPGTDIDFFDFPQIGGGDEGTVVGGGDVAAAFVNNEDVAKLLDYLATPEAGKIWVSTGAIASPNKGVTAEDYPNDLVSKEAKQLLEAKTFRFDGSDLLPGTLGQNFGTLLQNIIKTPNNMDSLLDNYQSDADQAGFGA